MGYHKDLGTSQVEEICEITGYPKDSYGRLLNPISDRDGTPEKDWNKKGTTLYNLTSPYGHLIFAHGTGDDFLCADYATINSGPLGEFLIIETTFNSESSSYIGGVDYEILPINSHEEKVHALRIASKIYNYVEQRHSRKGWNQDEEYFARSVAKALFPSDFKQYKYAQIGKDKKYVSYPLFSDREMRFGGKKINKVMDELLTSEE